MKTSLLSKQLREKIIHHNLKSDVLNKTNKKRIFIGTPQNPPPKISFYTLALSAGFLSTGLIINHHAQGKRLEDNNKKSLSKQKAHDIILNHTLGHKQPQLLDAAITLGYYDCHANNESMFFRGEKVNLSVIQNIEEKLDQILELKEHTPITSSLDVATNFTNAPFLVEIMNMILEKINIRSNQDKKKSVFYEVKIPKDVRFIKIPNNTYSGDFDEINSPHNENEFVLPKRTLIKIIKNENQNNSEKFCYTIHVLSNDEVKAYYEKNTTDKKNY